MDCFFISLDRHYCEPRMKHAFEEIYKISLMKILGSYGSSALLNQPIQLYSQYLFFELQVMIFNKKIVTPYGKNKNSKGITTSPPGHSKRAYLQWFQPDE